MNHHITNIMKKAAALLPAANSEDLNAYDKAMDELEAAVCKSMFTSRRNLQQDFGSRVHGLQGFPLSVATADSVDELQGLPVVAALDDAPFPPFVVPDRIEPTTPAFVQLLDDIKGATGVQS